MKFKPRTSTSWETEHGYIIAVCKTPDPVYQITRPKGSAPFAYTPDKTEVRKLINIDIDEAS